MAEEEDFLESQIPLSLTKSELAIAQLRELPTTLQRRAIRNWLLQRNVSEVSFEAIERVKRLLGGGAPAKVNLALGRHARRRAGRIFLE